MAFGKKIDNVAGNNNNSNNGSGGSDNAASGEAWNNWNNYMFDSIDAESTTNARGNEVKEVTQVGLLNFMIVLGMIPQADASYDTKVALPAEGEDNSPEELAHIAKFPENYYKWVTDNGKQVRKQFRKCRPEEELGLMFDFPTIMLDYSQHPKSEATEADNKPLRISYNGWWNPAKDFNYHIRNSVNFKTKQMSEKNALYKIAKAAGVLEQYIASGYNYAELAEAVVNIDIIATKRVWEGKTYVDFSIKNPAPITDIKFKGKVVASKEEQIAESECDVAFVGIELNDGDYPKESLDVIRYEYLQIASKAVAFKPSPEKHPDFELGINWVDSDLYKALKEGGYSVPDASGNFTQASSQSNAQTPSKESNPSPKQTPKVEEKVVNPTGNGDSVTNHGYPVGEEDGEDFTDVPF